MITLEEPLELGGGALEGGADDELGTFIAEVRSHQKDAQIKRISC